MKDGVLVQTGTPEEIVTNPADNYVAEFVAGISRLKLICARSIMVPIESYKSDSGSIGAAPRVLEDSDLDQLIDVSIETPGPIVITNTAGVEVGVVDQEHLLHGIQGSKEKAG